MKRVRLAGLALLLSVSLGACMRGSGEGDGKTPGEKMSEGASDVGELLREGATKVSEAASDAADAVRDAVTKASEKLEEDGRVGTTSPETTKANE